MTISVRWLQHLLALRNGVHEGSFWEARIVCNYDLDVNSALLSVLSCIAVRTKRIKHCIPNPLPE
jgi:hypothetical protein